MLRNGIRRDCPGDELEAVDDDLPWCISGLASCLQFVAISTRGESSTIGPQQVANKVKLLVITGMRWRIQMFKAWGNFLV